MQTIALKFGGSSLASAEQYRKVAAIIRADPARRYIIASAPGKRTSADTKITDALYQVYELAKDGGDFTPVLDSIAERYRGIASELGVKFDVDAEIARIRRRIESSPERDYLASRGEYLGSRLLAAFLEVPFVDAEKTVVFRENGALDPEATNKALGQALLVLHPVEVRRVPERVGLLLQGGDELRMAMTERGHGNTAGEINVLFTLLIPYSAPLALHRNKFCRCINRQNDFIECSAGDCRLFSCHVVPILYVMQQ